MKKTVAIVLSLVLVLAFATISFAGGKQVTGEVTAVDASAITVKGKSGEVTASIVDGTKIKGEAKTLEEVKTGAKVTLMYEEADGKNTAKSIEVKAAKKAGGY